MIAAFARQHTPVDMVQIGNEITAGMLWPLGQIYAADPPRWPEFATLVKAGLAGALTALAANLADLATRYGKPLVVAETSYPWTMTDGDDLANSVSDPAALPEGDAYPPTPAGQAAYFAALRRVLHGVPGALGFFVWEPEWLPGVGWEPGAGNPNDNLTMFDRQGRALPSVRTAFAA